MSQTSIILVALLIVVLITMTMQGTLAQFLGYLGLHNPQTPSNPAGYTSPSGNLIILPVGA